MTSRQHRNEDLDGWIRWAEGLLFSAGAPNPRLDAESLAAGALGVERLALHLDPRPLEGEALDRFTGWLRRRIRREPLQYILGQTRFFGRTFRVTPDVLIPRPETELLVEACLQARARSRRILDVGTGSGCVAVTLACEIPRARVVAVDTSEKALTQARENARIHEVADRILWFCGDLSGALRNARFDLIAANLPYIATGEMPSLQREVRDFEPAAALAGGEDGLVLIRRIITAAPRLLDPGGLLVLEIGADHAAGVRELIRETGSFDALEIRRDLAGYDRLALATRGPNLHS